MEGQNFSSHFGASREGRDTNSVRQMVEEVGKHLREKRKK